MKRGAILARGPSIWRTWATSARDQYAVTLGINTVVNVFSVDWIVACDPYTYEALRHKPAIGRVIRSDLGDYTEPWPDRLLTVDGTRKQGGAIQYPVGMTPEYSMETAICFALQNLGCDAVDMYGVDMGGDDRTAEIPGVRVNDNAERWAKETRAMDRIMAEYPHRIRRITDAT